MLMLRELFFVNRSWVDLMNFGKTKKLKKKLLQHRRPIRQDLG